MGKRICARLLRVFLTRASTDFELIIVDNHSTDSSAEIVESYDDARIILTRPDEPLHLAQALNHAASMARGEYVARMDADDVSHPARFEKQVQYMREHPSVGILGSQIRPIDGDGELIAKGSYRKPEAHEDICWSLFFGCPLWHPTVMLRKAVIDELGWYGSSAIEGREQYSTEDYDLWCRAIAHTKIHNLPEILLDYRIHADNHSLGKSRLKEHRRNVRAGSDPVYQNYFCYGCLSCHLRGTTWTSSPAMSQTWRRQRIILKIWPNSSGAFWMQTRRAELPVTQCAI